MLSYISLGLAILALLALAAAYTFGFMFGYQLMNTGSPLAGYGLCCLLTGVTSAGVAQYIAKLETDRMRREMTDKLLANVMKQFQTETGGQDNKKN